MSSDESRRPLVVVGGTNLAHAHRHNRRAVFETLRVNGPLSRAEIARATGLAKQTIANIVEPMIDDGLLREEPARIGGRGQPAIPVAISADGAHAVGVHVEHGRMLGVVVDLAGRTVARLENRLAANEAGDFMPALRRIVARLRRGQAGQFLGLGVATPGPFETEPAASPGFGVVPGWNSASVAALLRDAFGDLVFLENDATAAAAGERRVGAGAAITDFVYLYLGLGVGAGLVIDGSIYRGAGRNAGELGLLPQPGAPTRTLESSLSLVALCDRLGWDPEDAATHGRLGALTPGTNPALEAWMAEARGALAHAVLTLEMLFDPECVIVGGLIPTAILVRLLKETRLPPSVALRRGRKHPRLIAGTGDAWTAAIGAAASPIASAFDPEFRVLRKV